MAWRARFCAVCWRPRALPPLRAAALRFEAVEPPERARDAELALVAEPPLDELLREEPRLDVERDDELDRRPPLEPLDVSAISLSSQFRA